MTNYDLIKKMAEEHQGDDDAFIHVEMKDGRICEIAIAGNGVALLYAVEGIISRLAELSNTTFQETLETVENMHY